jgi:hypothetical protein
VAFSSRARLVGRGVTTKHLTFGVDFSPLYNTGFFPLNTQPHVYVMPGTIIEGGYDAEHAVTSLHDLTPVTYIRTDDWPSMGNPLAAAFARQCYRVVSKRHVPGYLVEQLQRRC